MICPSPGWRQMVDDALAARGWSYKQLVAAIQEYEGFQGREPSTFGSLQSSLSRLKTREAPHNLQTLLDVSSVLSIPPPVCKVQSAIAFALCEEAIRVANDAPDQVSRALGILRSLQK